MNKTAEFLKRESDKLGYSREYFLEKNVPDNPSDIIVVAFYGELRSLFWFSSVIFNKLVEENVGKYIILCSWPGMKGLFPNVNEYWSIKDQSQVQKIGNTAGFFNNTSDFVISEYRNLIYRFEHVYKTDDFNVPELTHLKLHLPQIPSVAKVNQYIRNQLQRNSIVIFPNKNAYVWENKELKPIALSKNFWDKVVHKLLGLGYKPVIWQNVLSHDLSPEFAEKCTYLNNMAIEDVMSVMHEVGLVLDMFSGVSKIALQSRTSFISVDERERYIDQQDALVEDNWMHQLQKLYVFSFAKLSTSGNLEDWCNSFLDAALVKLEYFKTNLDKRVDCVLNQMCDSIDCIPKKKEYKKMGLHFIT